MYSLCSIELVVVMVLFDVQCCQFVPPFGVELSVFIVDFELCLLY